MDVFPRTIMAQSCSRVEGYPAHSFLRACLYGFVHRHNGIIYGVEVAPCPGSILAFEAYGEAAVLQQFSYIGHVFSGFTGFLYSETRPYFAQ